jgi:uncharacterized membrane protein YjdF
MGTRSDMSPATARSPEPVLVGIVVLLATARRFPLTILTYRQLTAAAQSDVAYLGTQGDPLDAQWDMSCAVAGLLISQALFIRVHDRQLRPLRDG